MPINIIKKDNIDTDDDININKQIIDSDEYIYIYINKK